MSSQYPVSLHLIHEESYLIHLAGLNLILQTCWTRHIILFKSNKSDTSNASHHSNPLSTLSNLEGAHHFLWHYRYVSTQHSCYSYLPCLRWHCQRYLPGLRSCASSIMSLNTNVWFFFCGVSHNFFALPRPCLFTRSWAWHAGLFAHRIWKPQFLPGLWNSQLLHFYLCLFPSTHKYDPWALSDPPTPTGKNAKRIHLSSW